MQVNISIDFTCKVKQSAVGIPANKLVAYFSRVGNFVGFFALLHFLSGNQAAVSRVKCYSEHLLRPFSGVSDVVSNAFGSIKLSFAIKPTYKGIALACVHCRSSNQAFFFNLNGGNNLVVILKGYGEQLGFSANNLHCGSCSFFSNRGSNSGFANGHASNFAVCVNCCNFFVCTLPGYGLFFRITNNFNISS